MKFALTTPLSRNVIVICVSLQEPGTIVPTLKKWAKIIDTQIQNIFDKSAIADARKARKFFFVLSFVKWFLSDNRFRVCAVAMWFNYIR